MIKTNNRQVNKSILSIIAALAILIISRIIPLPENLSSSGMASIALLIVGVILWITESIPLAITAILTTILMPYFSIMPLSDVFARFTGSTFFFVMATFSMTIALTKTTIPTRIVKFILQFSKNNSRRLIFGFMFGTALLSSVMSNVPACIIFMSIALTLIKANGSKAPGSTNLGKCLMITIPYASALGGFCTPAGTANNILAISLLKELTGINFTFLDWMIVGIPMCIIGIFICASWTSMIFKPEPITEEAIIKTNKLLEEIGPLSIDEKKILAIILIMFILWTTSTWFPIIDITIVALLGMCAFFMPGINVLTWEEFSDGMSWDILFMIGGVGALASGLMVTGAASWLVNTILANATNWSSFTTILATSAISALLHIFIPAGPAVVAVAVPPLLMIANIASLNPVAIMLICTFWGGIVLIQPFDAIPLITYKTGEYSIKDMLKAGIVPTLLLIFIAALFIPPLVSILGY